MGPGGQQRDRRRITLLLLKRVAVLALALSAALLVLPRLLVEVGVLGPGPDQAVESARRAVDVARGYGAPDELPPFVAARGELERARALLREGRGREARRAAARARTHAIEAQRTALLRREEARVRAKAIVRDLDRTITELEDLYSKVTPGLDKPAVSRLFSLMKDARQAAATLVLAYEQGDYAKVIAGEKAARDVLESTGNELRSARLR